jgi:predicted Zn finger-like uncharacterized protein
MRLICPNCGAQYEVPQSVIPETGRDVQCSGCGHTWFQIHPDMQPAAQDATQDADTPPNLWDDADDDVAQEPAPAETRPASATPPPPPQPAPAQPSDLTPQDDDAVQDDRAGDEWEGFPADPGLTDTPDPGQDLRPDPEAPLARLPEVAEDDYEEDPANDLPPPRRGLDTSIADLLREEAEREARARAAERGPALETQPELGLESAPARQTTPATTLRQRPEPARPEPQPEKPQTAQTLARSAAEADRSNAAAMAESRRGLLPDIEEINSSLRHSSDRRPARAQDHAPPRTAIDPRDVTIENRRGFSLGFTLTLLIAVVLLALYIFAPALAEAVPALTPAVDGYVAAVDQVRLMLDTQVQNLSRWLAEVAGSAG